MQINKTSLDFLYQEWDQRFQSAFNRTPLFWDRYATLMPSGTEQSVHSWIEEQTGLTEWYGPREIDNVVARDYTLKNKPFQKTIGLDKYKVLDDTYGVFGPQADQLGQQAAEWPDDVMTSVLEAGTTELSWDGQPMFDTDHPVDIDDATKGTYVTNFVGSQYNLDIDPIAVWKAIELAGMTRLGTNGRPLNVMFDMVMVPPALKDAGLRLIKQSIMAQAVRNLAGTDNVAAAGVTNIYEGALTLVVNPKLRVANAAYFFDTKRPIKPLIWQLRQPPEFQSLISPTDPNVFMLRKFLYGCDARGAGGYSFPWLGARVAAS